MRRDWRCSTWRSDSLTAPPALNVSVFSLPESYEGRLNHLPSPCALARAASIYCQDPSANGEAAVDARDKLVLGEGAR